MAFKNVISSQAVPDSPEKLFLDLPRRKIPNVMPHQEEIMQAYAKDGVDKKDIALQLPTGSGKTLVGLLIGEWRRLKNQEKVVYLCPTRQLVNQVVEQAREKYGISVIGFTGSISKYSQSDKSRYKNIKNIAVTTYNSLFNTNPYFRDADIIIVDDVHTAENYVASLWSIEINRYEDSYNALFTAISNLLKPVINSLNYKRLTEDLLSINDLNWVEKVPTPEFFSVHQEFSEIMEQYVLNTELEYPWSMVKENLAGCHLYLSRSQILLRPLIPPTWTHSAFNAPKQRIYMSATLGEGGDLERLLGRRKISRLSIPDGWKRHGVGRRFFMFPNMSLNENHQEKLKLELMKAVGRSLVLVPSHKHGEQINVDDLEEEGYSIFGADDIEESKVPFVSNQKAIAIVANRYDGIDFPGEECRLLFVEGLPKAVNIQEKFIMSRMGARALFTGRIQTRILQAIGRCTRSLEDFSAVVISGEELTEYFSGKRHTKYFNRELQAEVKFGIEQSIDVSFDDIVENFQIFLENGESWEDVNQQIVNYRRTSIEEEFPALDQLSSAVDSEIRYQEKLWQGDFEEALILSEEVLEYLGDPELRGYRALWHYLAGSAAWMGAQSGLSILEAKAKMHYRNAKDSASAVPWLVGLSKYQDADDNNGSQNSVFSQQVENIETILEKLGTAHSRNYTKKEKGILEGIRQPGNFERAHEELGEMLGFNVGNQETKGAPDPWWSLEDNFLVFEDHAGAKTTSILNVTKARQVSSHPTWVQKNLEISSDNSIIPVLITPVTSVEKEALTYLQDVAIWQLNEFQDWVENALSVIRQLRSTLVESGDLVWRSEANELLKKNGLTMDSISLFLRNKVGNHTLKPQ